MSFKSIFRTLTGQNKGLHQHTTGLKNLKNDFPAEHPGRDCIDDLICEILEGDVEIMKIPATDRFDVPPTGARQIWENQYANQKVEPLQYYYPEGLFTGKKEKPLVEILRFAKANNYKVKAAGSGHSFSDVATTYDLFINTHGLCKVSSDTTIQSRNMKPGDDPVIIAGAIEGAIQQSWLVPNVTLANKAVSWDGYEPLKNKTLVEMQCGIRLHYLNEVLEAWDLGLSNMGGYDGQTIVGATMTSTHGTGITLPPFPDSVRSLVLCTTSPWTGKATVHGGGGSQGKNGEVYLYRLESASNPVCQADRYNDPQIGLIQDDEVFHAAICNMGTFGIIYSFTIEVMQKYYLRETREMTNLESVLHRLKPVDPTPENPMGYPKLLTEYRHVELIVHPYPLDENGKVVEMTEPDPTKYYKYFKVILEKWNIAKPDAVNNPKDGHRNYLSGFLGKFRLSFDVTTTIFYNCPSLIPMLITKAMTSLEDCDHVAVAPEIFVNGMSQYSGFGNEIAYPLEDGKGLYSNQWFEASINRIHKLAQSNRLNGQTYQSSPFSVRFVKKSNALLSMQHGIDTAMIELDLAYGDYGGMELLYRLQSQEYSHGGIPHWGLEFDQMTGSNDLISRLYPKTLSRWKAVYDIFNADGRFNNSFTDRVGFSMVDFRR
ncbi:MAG: hypothetical protein H6581_22490 [Bacteroidia bacterium]|nr:hypothetical protein [Bacteroidia bacterium]